MKLPPRTQVTFNVNLLHPLVTGTLPNYFRFDPEQEDFEAILLPLEAATQNFPANAKVALILEQIFLYMMSEEALTATVALRKAMEAGIKARHAVKEHKGKRGNTEDKQQAKVVLEACSERLRGLWELLKMAAKMGPRSLVTSHVTESDTDGDDQQPSPAPRKGEVHKKRKRGSGSLSYNHPKRK
jgi:superfamily I DNA/RNA helicase